MSIVLEVQTVTHSYGGGDPVLDAVSLSVQAASVHCLIGPSGCGKTTLLRVIAGLETPASGDVLLHGQVATNDPPHERSLGYVFQDASALFPTTVWKNVEFPLRWGRRQVKGTTRREAVEKALVDTQLDAHKHFHVSRLSGGLGQRVGLARAMVFEPGILLLDEPLSSLDAVLKRDFLDRLKYLRDTRDVAILYVTHDDREVRQVADFVTVLEGGAVLQSGTLSDVLGNPATDLVKTLMSIA